MSEIGRPMSAGMRLKIFLRARGETLHPQLPIKKDGPDIGRGHQVIQVGVRPAQLFDAALELVVNRDELFVDRLQFFLARLQLFRRGTHLFVHRLELFVGSFQLFIGRFVLLAAVAELVFEECRSRLRDCG